MVDVLTTTQRAYCMSRIGSKNTKPEIVVRRLLHRMGYRFRLHRVSLPGKPDLVLPRHRKIIMVHGCFWHKHSCRYGRVQPKTNAPFWEKKRGRNVERDRRVIKQLRAMGWRVLTVWECQTRKPERLVKRLAVFLTP